MATARRLPLELRVAHPAMHRQTDARLARRCGTADRCIIVNLLARRDGDTLQELVRRASSDPDMVRAVLVLLEKRGLVARMGHPTDGRARTVSRTHEGRLLHERLPADTAPLRKRLRPLFRSEEWKALIESRSRITDALSARSKHD